MSFKVFRAKQVFGFVEVIGAHGLAVFGAQEEDVADFDAAESFEGGAAVWACVAFFGEDEVVDFCHIEIASGFDMYYMPGGTNGVDENGNQIIITG